MEKIIFKKQEYLGKHLAFEFGKRLISVVSLEDNLMTDGNYVSEEARIVDEQIFYYVEDSEIQTDNDTLIQKIISEI